MSKNTVDYDKNMFTRDFYGNLTIIECCGTCKRWNDKSKVCRYRKGLYRHPKTSKFSVCMGGWLRQ